MIRIVASALLLFSITPAAASENDVVAPEPKVESPCLTDQQAALDARLTGVFPSCSELTSSTAPVARKVGDDWILVIPDVENDRYIKVGVALSADGEPPAITWQGASLGGAISQACSGNEPGRDN